jgi:hypothetical protein
MSNPHTRAHYPYQNDIERHPESDPATTQAATRTESLPRAAIDRLAEDGTPYRAAPPMQPEAWRERAGGFNGARWYGDPAPAATFGTKPEPQNRSVGDALPTPAPTAPGRDRRGPKGYVRSDERIRDEICERLFRESRLEVSDVCVEVKDGEVLITGSVPERPMKHAVEDIAADCWGVKDIDNRLRVVRCERRHSEAAPSVWRNRLANHDDD